MDDGGHRDRQGAAQDTENNSPKIEPAAEENPKNLSDQKSANWMRLVTTNTTTTSRASIRVNCVEFMTGKSPTQNRRSGQMRGGRRVQLRVLRMDANLATIMTGPAELQLRAPGVVPVRRDRHRR